MAQEEMKDVLAVAERNPGLFGEETVPEKINRSLFQIASLYVHQLKKHWRYVTDIPLALQGTGNVPSCTFIGASDNTAVHALAGRIVGREG
jgi:hypothetical protein